VVLLAGSSLQALKRSMDSLVVLYSKASPDIRAALHMYVGLDTDDSEMRQVAQSYALETMGMVKLVHHSSNEEHESSNKKYDKQQQDKAGAADDQAGGNAVATPAGPKVPVRRQLLNQPTTGKSPGQKPSLQLPEQQVPEKDKPAGHSSQQQAPQPQLSAPRHRHLPGSDSSMAAHCGPAAGCAQGIEAHAARCFWTVSSTQPSCCLKMT